MQSKGKNKFDSVQ